MVTVRIGFAPDGWEASIRPSIGDCDLVRSPRSVRVERPLTAIPIATGAIKPKIAVALAALLNLVGAFHSTEVAKTISGSLIRERSGGIRITRKSSSHALFGGLIGAAVVGMGLGAVDFDALTAKVILPAVFPPVIAAKVVKLPKNGKPRVVRTRE
ncbi:hypothetical protein GCM10023063_13610 [Arthrobacter methylotrophus]